MKRLLVGLVLAVVVVAVMGPAAEAARWKVHILGSLSR